MEIDEMKIRDERQFKALTGVSPEEFQRLLPVFTTSYKEMVQERYGQRLRGHRVKGVKSPFDSYSLLTRVKRRLDPFYTTRTTF